MLSRLAKVSACQRTSQKSEGTVAFEENVENLHPKIPRKPRFGIPARLNVLTGRGRGVIEEGWHIVRDSEGLWRRER